VFHSEVLICKWSPVDTADASAVTLMGKNLAFKFKAFTLRRSESLKLFGTTCEEDIADVCLQ